MNEVDEINITEEVNTPSTEETQRDSLTQEDAFNISRISDGRLDAIILLIGEGLIPTVIPYIGGTNLWKLYYLEETSYILNNDQYNRVMEAIRNHEDSEERPSESPLDMEYPYFENEEEEGPLTEPVVEEEHNEIPKNSPSLLIDESTSRFSSAIWYEKIQTKVITLAGVGGIGSYVGFLLARMKPSSLFIYDPDIVETVNMSGQLYGRTNVGQYKVEALSDMIYTYTEFCSVFAIPERFDQSKEASDIMICGFDNMEARKIFFHKWLNNVNQKPDNEKKNCLYIDGRLAAEEFQVLCIKGDDTYNIHRYSEEFLFSDLEADATICSYKQTTFMANMIASVMVNLFVNFVANQCNPLIERDLPFYTAYNAETMFYKTEA